MMAASLALPRAACALSTAILPASPERRSPQPSPIGAGMKPRSVGMGRFCTADSRADNRMALNLRWTGEGHWKRSERRIEMLGLGLVGTIIVVVLVVWLIRRV